MEAVRPPGSLLMDAATADPPVRGFSETTMAAAPTTRSTEHSRSATLSLREDGGPTCSWVGDFGCWALGTKGGLSVVGSIWLCTTGRLCQEPELADREDTDESALLRARRPSSSRNNASSVSPAGPSPPFAHPVAGAISATSFFEAAESTDKGITTPCVRTRTS